jgi:hypothetical protein
MLNNIASVLNRVPAPSAPPVSGFTLWLDAATSSASNFTFGSGNYVSQWTDKSGNGNHFTQATSGSQPLWTANSQNGLGGVYCYVSNIRFLVNTSLGNFSYSPFTMFVIYKEPNTPNFVALMGRNLTGALAIGGDNSNPVKFGISRIGQATSVSNLEATKTNADTLVYKSAGVSAGNISVDIYKNGTAASGAVSLAITSAGDRNNITGDTNGTGDIMSLDGFVCEYIMYPSQLSDTDRNSVESYLKTKWGTP